MSIGNALLDRIRELNASIAIRPAVAADAGPFTELMNRQYRRKKTEEYFHWQFMNFSNPSRLFVAFEKDIFVGCYGIQVHTLSNSVLCGFTIDLLIREEYRNRAILVLFEEEARNFALEQGAQFMTSLPNLSGKNAHAGLNNWKHIGTVKTYTLPGAEINESKVIPERGRPGGEFLYFSKSADYRKWRYDMNPEYAYTYVRLNTGEFAVTKTFNDPFTGKMFGDIVDFECNLHNQTLLKDLFLKACRSLKDTGVEAITTWALPHTSLCDVAESLGFTETQPERYFCFKALKTVEDFMYNFSRWHLVQADSEIY